MRRFWLGALVASFLCFVLGRTHQLRISNTPEQKHVSKEVAKYKSIRLFGALFFHFFWTQAIVTELTPHVAIMDHWKLTQRRKDQDWECHNIWKGDRYS